MTAGAIPGNLERLGQDLRAGRLDPRALCLSCLERATEPALAGAFITLTPERALREAEASRRRLLAGRPASALDGIPVAWKDLVDIEGLVTSAGSALLRDGPPATADAPLVMNLARLGMVSVGKTGLSEFAFSGLGLNPHFGTPVNPWSGAEPRIPGGSSSGNAVAIAAGAVPAAVGTDTSGSVRVPAAFNGIAGFRPSRGSYDLRGVFPLSRTLDVAGPMAAAVQDCVLLHRALGGQAPAPAEPLPLRDLHILVPAKPVLEHLEDDIGAALEEVLHILAARGARIEQGPLQAFEQAQQTMDAHGTLVAAEARELHGHRLRGPQAEALDPRIRQRLEQAAAITARDLEVLHRVRREAKAGLAQTLGERLLLHPATPCTAPRLRPLLEDDELFHTTNRKVLRNTMPGSFLDLPGTALASGLDRHGLPIGMLLSGPPGADLQVLAAALAVERALDDAGVWTPPAFTATRRNPT